MKTPTILTEIAEYLRQNTVKLDTKATDGRVGSVTDEAAIINKLQNHFGKNVIQSVPVRRAGDMLVVTPTETFVVNIKTTWGVTNDNAQSWGGFLLAFTDIPYEKIDPSYRFNKWAKLILANKKETSRDYWFLVVSKHIGKDQKVMFRGLKQITHGAANPSNFLQIRWGREFMTETPNFTFDQSWKNMVEGIVIKAYQKRLETIKSGLKIFGLTS